MAVLYVVLTWRCRQDEMAREAAAFEAGQRAAGLPDKYFHLMVPAPPAPAHPRLVLRWCRRACPAPRPARSGAAESAGGRTPHRPTAPEKHLMY